MAKGFLKDHPTLAEHLKNPKVRRFVLIGVGALAKWAVTKLIFDRLDNEELED